MKRLFVVVALLVSGCAGSLSSLPRWEADVRQPVTDDLIHRIVPGTPRDQVLKMIGPPLGVVEFPRQREISWEYRFVDTWGYPSYLYVNFDAAGVVVSRFTSRIERTESLR